MLSANGFAAIRCISWAVDDDKLTFIVLDKALLPPAAGVACADSSGGGGSGGASPAGMVGDVNLFFHHWLVEEGEPLTAAGVKI